ncbi:unnamed protein product, partial [Rotaria sordida]
LFLPIKFPFLPVERISVKLNLSNENNIIQYCNNNQCINGQCIQYLINPNQRNFCRCKSGWTGEYCYISYVSTCSFDSLCVGIGSNNRSMCICPINKFGSQCLLTNNICQRKNQYQNNGTRLSYDEFNIYPYSYICSNSLVIYWSNPFNIIFIQISPFEYYSIADKTINDQSSVIIHTINQLDRCRSIYKIFNETMTRIHIIQCIKYYHLPCQNLSLNLSCFYDDIHICSCQYYGDQRLANCFEFNHYDLNFDNETLDYQCYSNNSFHSFTLPCLSTLSTNSAISPVNT